MRNGAPWRVRGIRAETRDTAREAARRSGLSVGEWLDSVVLDSAAEEGVRTATRRRDYRDDFDEDLDRRPAADLHGIHDRLDALTRHLENLSRTARAPRQVYPAPDDHAVDEDLFAAPVAPTPAPKAAASVTAPSAATPAPVVVAAGLDEVADALARIDRRLDQLVAENRAPEPAPQPYAQPQSYAAAPIAPHLTYAPPAHRAPPATPSAPDPAFSNWTPDAPPQTDAAPLPHVPYDAQPNFSAAPFTPEAAPARQPNFAAPPVKPWMGLVDDAMAEIKSRQQVLDFDASRFSAPTQGASAATAAAPPAAPLPAQNFQGLEQHLRHLTRQIETMRTPALEQSVESLRGELREIARSVLDAVPRSAIEALEHEVKNLIARIDNGRTAGIDNGALSALERGLDDIRQTLRTLTPAENLSGIPEAVTGLARKIDTIGAAQPDPAAVAQLENAIRTLREIVAHVASNDALAQLTAEVRKLAERVEQIAGSSHGADILATLESRIAYIADALEARTQNGGSVPPQLEAVINGLSDKIERVQMRAGDTVALGQLEDRIIKLADKLDASGARLGNLEAIERGLADILSYLENQRGKSGTASETLHRDLARTQNSLEAVHGTLSHVVSRIATLEKDMVAKPQPPFAGLPRAPYADPAQAPAAPPQMPGTAPRRPPLPAQPQPPLPAQQQAAPQAAHQPSRAALAAAQAFKGPPNARTPIDPNLPPDHPLEPGHRAQGESPAARIAASEAALGPARPPVIPDPGGKANYIEAARRAARAAAQVEPAADILRPVAEEPLRPIPGLPGDLGSKFTGRIKSLLLGASVVILVGVALQMGLSLIHSDETGTSAPQAASPSGVAPGAKQSSAAPSADGDIVGSIGKRFNYGPRVTPKDPTEDTTRQASAPAATPDGKDAIAAPPTAKAVTGDTLPDAIGGAPLRTAALAGNAAAQYEAGARYAEGRGVPLDLAAAARWFERAANQGLAVAQFRLGNLYEKGNGVPKDIEAARRLYLLAANQDNAKAMHNLAVLFAEGIKGKPDYQNASLWFRRAADHGVSDSQYNLGILYARGIGVPQNLGESYKWFSLAAAQGDQEAAKKRDDVTKKLDYKALENARRATQEWVLKPQAPAAIEVRSPPGGWDGPDAAARTTNAPIRLGAR